MVGVATRLLKPLILVILSWSVASRGQNADQDFTEPDAVFEYLLKYGYVKDSEVTTTFGAGTTEGREFLREKIKLFQDDVGLDMTGEMDTNTIEAMAAPRCGVPFSAEQVGLDRPKWNKKTLTYRIQTRGTKSGLSPSQVKRTMRRAFNYWENEADLKFKETTRKSDIEIMFATDLHGDGLPFDGSEGVLAHAYYPLRSNDIGGDAHFDDDEPWSVTDYSGKQLLQTATHELGHSLGLSHSRVKGSVMYYSYPGWDPNLQLHEDDINNIQELYGPSKNGPCVCEDYTFFDKETQGSIGNCLTTFRNKKWCYVAPGTSCGDMQKSSKVDQYWSWEACESRPPHLETKPIKIPPLPDWSQWSSWSSCSRTCGSGSQTRRRTCSGGNCQGSSSDRRICNSNSCPGPCQCNGVTRPTRTEIVGLCQTQYRGDYWCYIDSNSACEDKKGTRRNEDGKRYWSALACLLETPFQRDTEKLDQDYSFVFPDEYVNDQRMF